jgi:bifunctional enzyme CysN/CysC
LAQEAAHKLSMNDICVCNLALSKPIVGDIYALSKALGGFILVDKFSQATVAVGMIRHSLRRASNIHKQAVSIGRAERANLNGHQSQVIWLTGLSGSGKSTIANALEIALHAQGYRTYLLDGDNIRGGLNKDLGFTDADRVENIRRIAEVAKLMMDAGLVVITAFISPFRREREMARTLIGTENFTEIYVDTPLAICEQRDVKGLYKKARAGQLPNFSGISSVYEPPTAPVVIVGSTADSVENTVDLIMRTIFTKR